MYRAHFALHEKLKREIHIFVNVIWIHCILARCDLRDRDDILYFHTASYWRKDQRTKLRRQRLSWLSLHLAYYRSRKDNPIGNRSNKEVLIALLWDGAVYRGLFTTRLLIETKSRSYRIASTIVRLLNTMMRLYYPDGVRCDR